MDLRKYLGKRVKITLNNSYEEEGKVVAVDDFVSLIDDDEKLRNIDVKKIIDVVESVEGRQPFQHKKEVEE